MSESYRVQVESAVPASAVEGLADFITTHYLTPNIQYLKDGGFSSGKDGARRNIIWTLDPSKSARVLPAGFPELTVRLSVSPGETVVEFPGADVSRRDVKAICDHIADDIEAVATSYLTHAKRTSLHFLFSVGHQEWDMPKSGGFGKDALKRIFAGNNMNLYLILMAVSFVFILLLGPYGVVAIVVVQLLALIFSDRLILGAGTVRVTEQHPEVAVVRVSCSPEVFQSLKKQGRKVASSVRDEIDKAVSSGNVGDPATKDAVYRILQQAGVTCSPDDIEVRKTNPYETVKKVAARFGMPMPKITLVNTPVDNAAATGISPGHASITITAGALEDLGEDELQSVLGHEFGHIRGRDAIILFIVTMVVYLGGLYLWLPIIIDLGLFYFLIAFGFIYLVGKFLETRADTESVMVLGQPGVLASALTRIGFAQLYYERYSSQTRFFDWLRFDPHPPIYFRVGRLAKMSEKDTRIKHALLDSVRDVVSGFFGSLLGS